MKYKTSISFKILVSIAVFFASTSILGSAQPAEDPFLAELSGLLQEEGWTSEEIDRLRAEIQTLGREPAENADPRAVALALSMSVATRSTGLGIAGRARLVIELAEQSAQMSDLGFDDMAIASAALRRASESTEITDSPSRVSVAEAVQAEARRATATQIRGRPIGRGPRPLDVVRRNPTGIGEGDSLLPDVPDHPNPTGGEQ